MFGRKNGLTLIVEIFHFLRLCSKNCTRYKFYKVSLCGFCLVFLYIFFPPKKDSNPVYGYLNVQNIELLHAVSLPVCYQLRTKIRTIIFMSCVRKKRKNTIMKSSAFFVGFPHIEYRPQTSYRCMF